MGPPERHTHHGTHLRGIPAYKQSLGEERTLRKEVLILLRREGELCAKRYLSPHEERRRNLCAEYSLSL